MGKFKLKLPEGYTNEEKMLMQKYELLRTMKQAVEAAEAPAPRPKPIPDKVHVLDSNEAKERAKKLIRSGEVSISTKPTAGKVSFKRPRTFERKINEQSRPS